MVTPECFDVVVVGARCAGAPLALDLSRRGLRVCLVDRANFPSEVPSTHLIHPCGIARLAELGLSAKLLATGAPPLTSGRFVVDDVRLEMRPEVAARFEAPWLCIRRSVLDQILVEAATEGGVTVLTGTPVNALIEHEGRVGGVVAGDRSIHAGLVVGADGPHSAVARLVGAGEYQATPQGRTFVWGYFEGATCPGGFAALGRVGDLGFLAMPTDSGLYMAGLGVPADQGERYLADTGAGLMEGLARISDSDRAIAIDDYLRDARRVGPVRVMARWHGYFRQACGPGWVLVGDAGHFKDPTPAQGISDALRQGRRLASTVEEGLGHGNLDSLLQEWWRWRDDDAREMYWFATDMGAAGDSPGIVGEMLRNLGRQPQGEERFLRMLNHDLRPSQVFTARLAVTSLVRAAASNPRRLSRLAGETATIARQEMARRRTGSPLQSGARPISPAPCAPPDGRPD